MSICQRCQKEENSLNLSWLTEDSICNDCRETEKKHPLFQWGKHIEHLESVAGNRNYPGIFAGKSWSEIEAATPDILYVLQKIEKYNEKQIIKAKGKVEEAINLFEFAFNEKPLLSPFRDEEGKHPVHPLEYYGEDLMQELANRYSDSLIALLED